MTNATKSLGIIFVLLVIVTGIVKLTGNSTSSTALRGNLVEVDTAKVDRILLETANRGRTVTIEKENNSWYVTGSDTDESYPASGASVKQAFKKLRDLKVKAIATRDPEKFTRYKVDSTGTRVTLYGDGELLGGLIVGAPQILSRREFNNYVRPLDDQTVYTIDGFLGTTFSTSVESWRERLVWDFKEQGIDRVDFLYPADSAFTMRKAGPRIWVSDGDTLGISPVSTILGKLSTLRASGFKNDASVEEFGNELYALQISRENGETKTVRVKPAGDGDSYLAVATGYPYVFTLNKAGWDRNVLKARNELLEK